ncbi:TldD/PmbA family protein [Alkalicella caledoniensis]|uniref:TldD/PmbA family protein n=1 Tax=Alkalicella caledoniensis TaxID=2731377 RepID=A0A7G9WBI1_ALKCA|nr:metallopeptidase TldD-related protein [Alkalicella caledoniensis]QNO16043.1 TldD/PmbA family protein [Alkalicella caledoniensis]
MGKIFELASKNFQEAELYIKSEKKLSIRLSGDQPKGGDGSRITEYALRAVKNNNMGTAVTTSEEDISIVERAEISLANQTTVPVKFSNSTPASVCCEDSTVSNMKSEELLEEGLRISKLFAEVAPNIKPEISLTAVTKNIAIQNTAGFNANYNKTLYNVGVSTKSPKGFNEVYHVKNSSSFQPITGEDVEKLISMHKIAQNRVKGIGGKLPVIFSGKAMGSLILRVLAGVNSDIILKGISPVKDKMGEQVFSQNITIRDDGTFKGGLGTCAFDDEGTPGQNTLVYENGVLRSYLADISSATKLGINPTGNSFKRTMFSEDIEDHPSVEASNIIVEGLTVADDELFKEVKRGIFVESVMGAHTGNINAGDYSLNVSSGYLIEDGKLVGKVQDTMVAGNIYEDFKNVVSMGTELQPLMAIFFSLGYSPNVLFKDISVVVE